MNWKKVKPFLVMVAAVWVATLVDKSFNITSKVSDLLNF